MSATQAARQPGETELEPVLGEGLRLLAAVERQSRLLRAVDQPVRRYRVQGRLLLADGLERLPSLPFELPSELGPARQDLPAAKAEVVHMAGLGRLRIRAFYPAAGLSVAIHGRLRLGNPLGRGQRLAGRLGATPLVVPRSLERGRRLRHAWEVEELLSGRQVDPLSWPVVAPRLVDGLWSVWASAGLTSKARARALPAQQLAAGLAILESAGTSSTRAIERARRVAGLTGEAVVGLCHADPQPRNVLELPDGRLALLDWDLARRLPLAFDAVRVLRWLDEPLPLADELASRLREAAGVSRESWFEQLTAEVLRALFMSDRLQGRASRQGNARAGARIERVRESYLSLLDRLSAEEPAS